MDCESVGGDAAEAVVVLGIMKQFSPALFAPLLLLAPAASLAVEANPGLAARNDQPAVRPACKVDLWRMDPSQKDLEMLRLEDELARLEKQLQTEMKALRKEISRTSDPERKSVLRTLLANVEAGVSARSSPPSLTRCPIKSQASRDYVKEVVLRIEACGTSNFPVSEGESLYGSTVASFVTDAKGQLVSATISKSSSNPLIDAQVLRILRASAPFGPVPAEMKDGRYDRFAYRSSFDFKQDGETKAMTPPELNCSLSTDASKPAAALVINVVTAHVEALESPTPPFAPSTLASP